MSKEKTLIKKADNAVKTTESWMSFAGTLWEAKGFFTPVVVLATTMIAALLDIVTLGWGYAVFAGIGLFILASLVCLGISWIWHLRPGNNKYKKSISIASSGDEDKAVGFEDLRNTVQGVVNQMKLNEVELCEKLDSFKEETNRAIDALFQNKKVSDALKFGQLAAIQDAKKGLWEQSSIWREIEAITEILDTKEPIELFEQEFTEWKEKVDAWHSGISAHINYPSKDIFKIDPEKLKSRHWQDWVNNISNGDLQLAVKQFAILKKRVEKIHYRYLMELEGSANQTFNGSGARTQFVDRFRN